jgi:hypothetical protein
MNRVRCLVADVAVLALAAAALGVAGSQAMAAPPKKGVDADADRMLRQMTEYLASLQSFSVRTSVADELTMKTGEKLQTMSSAEVAVDRPNHLRSLQRGSPTGLGFWYDGKTMSVSCKANNSYQTLPAPGTLDAAIDQMRKQFDIDAPGADLLYSHPYDALMEQVVSGRFVGRETVDGVPANHLAFQGQEVDWQMWIQDGPKPLPLRYVITTKTVPQHPEFAVQMSDWNTEPRLPDAAFTFKPPEGATTAKSVAASCGGAP